MKLFFTFLFFLSIVHLRAQTEPPVPEKEIFVTVEEMPQFPGGIQGMQEFIKSHIKVPAMVMDSSIAGKCFLKFVVNSQGHVKDAQVLKGVPRCKPCDDEALRVVSLMPNWQPGKMDGRPVNVWYTLPLSFRYK